MSHEEFHLFHALPPEIQDSIWELCLPRRVSRPSYSSVSQEYLGRVPGTRHRADVPVRALIPFRPPLISRVCSRARATVLRCGQYTSVGIEEGDTKSNGSIWLNKKSDWVYFDYITMMNGLDDSGVGLRVFELARDVRVPLLIDSTIQGDHENGLHNSNEDEETVGSRLYDSFLKGRDRFYYVLTEVILVVSGRGRQHVVDTGLFGLLGEDTAIVPIADTAMLQRYYSLYNMYDVREDSYSYCVARVQHHLNSLSKGEDQGTHEPRTLIRGLLERICEERGEFDVSAEEMMNEDCSLKLDHPLVEQLEITMPTCEKVVLFELRRLETLLEDSVTGLYWDSTDSTDTDDTDDTADTDSDEV